MTLAEARKNGIPELGIKNECPGCAAGLPIRSGLHDEFRGMWKVAFACTAHSDEAIFAALWADRERLKERAEAIQEAVNKTAGVLIHANRNLSASVDLALEILHDYAPAPVDPTSSEELNGADMFLKMWRCFCGYENCPYHRFCRNCWSRRQG